MHYRTSFLIMAVIAGFALEAQAQDQWQGYYGGLNITASRTTADAGSNSTHRYESDNASFGLHVGYNFTKPSGFVWGPEIAITQLSNNGSKTDASLGTTSFEGSYLVTTKLRAGLARGKFLYYGAVGIGFSDSTIVPDGSTEDFVFGKPALGLGVEMAMDNGWSTRLEAMHYDFSNDSDTFNGTRPKVDTTIDTVSFGFSKRF